MGVALRALLAIFQISCVVWTTPVRAEPVCAPLEQGAFRVTLRAAQDALLSADVAAHERVMTGLQARIPCFAFVPTPHEWAELLVGAAVVAHATGGDWQAPLATAIHLFPEVERPVGGAHGLATWVPPPATPPTALEIPSEARIFVDGTVALLQPRPVGMHLYQRRTDRGLESILALDEPLPAHWLDAWKSQKIEVRTALTAGLGRTSFAVAPLGAFSARQGWGVPVGVELRAKAPLGAVLQSQVCLEGSAAGVAELTAGLGAAGIPARPWAGVSALLWAMPQAQGPNYTLFSQLSAGAQWRRGRLRAALQAGASPWSASGRARVEVALGNGLQRGSLGLRATERHLWLENGVQSGHLSARELAFEWAYLWEQR